MKTNAMLSIYCLVMLLAACTGERVPPGPATAKPAAAVPADTDKTLTLPGLSPDMTIDKQGNTLNLVRIMDGGVCKNDREGVKGVFLLYADPADMERIKRDQGEKIFGEFETQIQDLAAQALHDAVDKTNFSADPFALDAEEARQRLAQQLDKNFRAAIAARIAEFEKATTLAIDIAVFRPSLSFYQQGCDASRLDAE